MQYKNIPVVLVVAGKKIDYIPFIVKNLSKHCDFYLYYIVCPKKDIDRAFISTENLAQKIIIVNEELIIPGLTLNEVRKFLKLTLEGWPEHHLPGWYLQQFLKMGFSQYLPRYKYYLIWDADTLLTRAISFFDDEIILLTQGNEFHKEYFDTIKFLFNEINIQSISHISQHLLVDTNDMTSLINHLEKGGTKWWINILSSLNGKTSHQFSEYETYANFCLSTRPNSYRSINRMWFRYGKSYYDTDLPQADTTSLSRLYDFVAFEDWDSGFYRRIRSYIIVGLNKVQSIIRLK
jgi:hypothetical protein